MSENSQVNENCWLSLLCVWSEPPRGPNQQGPIKLPGTGEATQPSPRGLFLLLFARADSFLPSNPSAPSSNVTLPSDQLRAESLAGGRPRLGSLLPFFLLRSGRAASQRLLKYNTTTPSYQQCKSPCLATPLDAVVPCSALSFPLAFCWLFRKARGQDPQVSKRMPTALSGSAWL